jgi:threonine dehydratase
MVELNDVIEAHERLKGIVHETPVFSSTRINTALGCNIFFKCENLQRVGAFKFRGAYNALSKLPIAKLTKGVVTHSSGNHAQALALAAQLFGVKAYIVMPDNAPQIKIDAVAGYGAEIYFCKPNLEARESTADFVIKKTGASFVHPYNHHDIIAGQGTCAYELLNQLDSSLDIVLSPVGGGGLLSGTAISVKALSPHTLVYGAEPKNADDAYRSYYSGELILQQNPITIADGLLTSLGELNFEIIKQKVDDIILCSEDSIYLAMKLIFTNLKLVVEPSGAVPLACILDNIDIFKGKSVAIIISGGNIDISKFEWK